MKPSTLILRYLRKEPTNDTILKAYAPKARRYDVVAYGDSKAETAPVARWPWFYTDSKPRKGRRTVTLNCFTYAAVWLPDLTVG